MRSEPWEDLAELDELAVEPWVDCAFENTMSTPPWRAAIASAKAVSSAA
jgi:hypothetical protein